MPPPRPEGPAGTGGRTAGHPQGPVSLFPGRPYHRDVSIRPATLAATVLVLGMAALAGCGHGRGAAESPAPVEEGWTQKGEASWYGHPYHGRRTASGEIYDMDDLTAAHRTLPFGTLVRVTRRDTGASVTVRINDRGPFVRGRIIDLSRAAARRIGLVADGVAPVRVTVVGSADTDSRGDSRKRSAPAADAPCFWVQVGAFADPSNAGALRVAVRETGEPVVVLSGTGDGLHRVRAGPYRSEREAERARKRLADRWPGARIVPCG